MPLRQPRFASYLRLAIKEHEPISKVMPHAHLAVTGGRECRLPPLLIQTKPHPCRWKISPIGRGPRLCSVKASVFARSWRAAIGISVNTSEGRPILSNPALEKMLGYIGDELRTMDYLQFTHPDDRQSETRLMADLIAGRIDSYRVEKRYICKSGRMMWGRLTVSLLHQPDEESRRFVAMVKDITDPKRAESDSRQRKAELEVIAKPLLGDATGHLLQDA